MASDVPLACYPSCRNSLARRCGLTAAAAAALLAIAGCTNDRSSEAGAGRHVTIGIQVSPAMTLVMVAKEKGFFSRHGVDVELKEFTAGKFALQAFLAGGVDFAVSGEVPVALATLQGNEIRVVAQVVERTRNEVRIVARQDGTGTDPASYFKARRRRLATSFGGGPEFFTYTFMKRYRIPAASVEVISQKPEDMPASLATGSVDAVAIFEPFAYFAEKRSRDRVVVFADSSLYSELYVLDVTPRQIQERKGDITAVVAALADAGDFVAAHPGEAQAIAQKYTKLDTETIQAIWPTFVFRPALTSQLVALWTAQAEWAKATAKVPSGTPVPDFRALVDPSFLGGVRASAVSLH